MVTAQRSSTRQDRIEREKRKKEEEAKASKRRKEEQQMARLLAQRWAQEDQKKVLGKTSPEREDRDRRRRRRDRDDELPHGKRRRAESDGSDDRRRKNEDEDGSADEANDDGNEAEGAEEEAGGGGWRSFSPPAGAFRRDPISIRPNEKSAEDTSKAPETGGQKKGATGKTHAAKIAGVFGLSDSEDEKDSARRELQAAAKSKQSKVGLGPTSRIVTPGGTATSSSATATGGGSLPTSSDVQMRLAQWKMTCKGKWVDMPPDLRRDVERCMGKSAI